MKALFLRFLIFATTLGTVAHATVETSTNHQRLQPAKGPELLLAGGSHGTDGGPGENGGPGGPGGPGENGGRGGDGGPGVNGGDGGNGGPGGPGGTGANGGDGGNGGSSNGSGNGGNGGDGGPGGDGGTGGNGGRGGDGGSVAQKFVYAEKEPKPLMNDFKWHHFKGKIILWAVQQYYRYGVSYRDLDQMIGQGGEVVGRS